MSDVAGGGAGEPSRFALGKIGLSSAVSAALATVLQLLAARALGADGYARFLVVWGLFFALTGILPGLQQEIVRSVATAAASGKQGREPIFGTMVIGILGLALVVLFAPVWAPDLLGPHAMSVAVVLAFGFLFYAWANHVNGTLAATSQWSWYARAVLADGILRFLFLGFALLVGAGSVGWALGLVGPTLTWALLALSSKVRAATMSLGDADTLRFVQRAANSMLSSGCSALVIAGFPVLLRIFGGEGASGANAGAVLAVLMATRAPLLIFLNAYQGVAITRLVEAANPVRLMGRWLRIGLAISAAAAVGGYLLGPTLLRTVFGSDFVVSEGAFVPLVASSFVLAGITLTGWTALSLNRHSAFVGGWLIAVIATSAFLTIPMSVEGRVSVALIGGPLGGAAVHLLALRSDPTRADA